MLLDNFNRIFSGGTAWHFAGCDFSRPISRWLHAYPQNSTQRRTCSPKVTRWCLQSPGSTQFFSSFAKGRSGRIPNSAPLVNKNFRFFVEFF